jgi:hypothetical protein
MDVSLLATGDAPTAFNIPAHEVIDLSSHDTLNSEDVVSDQSLARDEDGDLESVSREEEEGQPSESFSLLEDVLEEMGDEHLFNGGKPQRYCRQPFMI